MRAKEARFAAALARTGDADAAAAEVGYSQRYARRLSVRADIAAEAALLREQAELARTREELREYLLGVMRGEQDRDDAPKFADRVRAAEFYERHFRGADEEDDEIRVVVEYGNKGTE